MMFRGGVLLTVCLILGSVPVWGGESAADQPTPENLVRRAFVLKSVDGKDFPADGNPPFIEFGGDLSVSGQACNLFRGKGRLENGVLRVEALILTRRFCLAPELNELDGIVSELLGQGAAITLDGGVLTLKRPEPPTPLGASCPAGETGPKIDAGHVLVYLIRDLGGTESGESQKPKGGLK
ncbi:MAG: META domain-containing protein [Planctomycetota bacterium]|jgi:heat shock protein HslJ|nr:META domain-containing protein [Planctomycetota bacterium]